MSQRFGVSDDEQLEELRLHCRVFGAVCARVRQDPRPGPFNSPYGAFLDVDGPVTGWISANHRQGLTYQELIEAVRIEAMSRATSGRLAGAALMVSATGPDGQDGLMVQLQTRTSNVTLLYEFTRSGDIIDDPLIVDPLSLEGLCFFT